MRRGAEASKQLLVAEDITRDQLAALESERSAPGIDLEARTRRVYPQKQLAAHLLGYLNMAGPDDPEARLQTRRLRRAIGN